MSVYNEPLNYVRDSVESILNQTLTDFEFIIVIDNPSRG
ncbi:glycosyltransferase, partial [Streptococcus agalactiae]